MKRKPLFRIAVSFLTILPFSPKDYEEGDLARAGVFFPLVGMFLGSVNLGIWFLCFSLSRDPVFSSFTALCVWILLTRGLHLDGVSDVCDALAVGREKRQAVLKDSRVGAFGVLGILLFLGWKFLALVGMQNPWYLWIAPVWGRIGVLQLGVFARPLPEGKGLGKEFIGRVPWWSLLLWMVLLGGGMVWWRGGVHVLKIAVSFGIMYTLEKFLSFHFGGLNGDMLGMGIEVGEILTLWWGRFWP